MVQDEAKILKDEIAKLQTEHGRLLEESVLIRRRIQKTQLIAKLKAEPTQGIKASSLPLLQQ